MKKQWTPAGPLFCLPNHEWRSQTEREGEGVVVRRNGSVLVRTKPLSFEEPNTKPNKCPGLKDADVELGPDTPSAYVCQNTEYLFNVLRYKALSGDEEASGELAWIAIEATGALQKLTNSNPKLFRTMARRCYGWPVIRFKFQALTPQEKKLFADIQLGAKAEKELDPATTKWKWDDAAKVAEALRMYLNRLRFDGRFNFGPLGREARKLPPFDDDSAPAWWELARRALLAAYPEPQEVDEFNSLVTSSSKRRSPGRTRQAIFDILKSRFLSFAPNRAYQT